MNQEERRNLRETLRKSRYIKSKEKGKSVPLTKSEMNEIIRGYQVLNLQALIKIKEKENWKSAKEEPKSIKDILNGNV
jgi:transcription antitermination factor NusG